MAAFGAVQEKEQEPFGQDGGSIVEHAYTANENEGVIRGQYLIRLGGLRRQQ